MRNMRGFELGFAAARGDVPVATQIAEDASPDAMAAFPEFPVETRYTIENGFRRCQDYQNRSYADGYIAKVRELTALDRSLEGATRGWKLTIEGARYLALRMTYEDVIRVADLKTRRDRFASVRNDAKAKADEPVLITEYLKPGPEEILRAAAAAAWQHLSQLAAPAGPRTSIQYRPLRQIPYHQRLPDDACAGPDAVPAAEILALCGRIRADVAMVRRGQIRGPHRLSIRSGGWPNAPIS